MVRAFLFPQDDSAIEIIWLPFDTDEEGKILVHKSLEHSITISEVNDGRAPPSLEYRALPEREVRGRNHRHRLGLWCRNYLADERSLPNRSVIATTNWKEEKVMRGPVLFVADAGLDGLKLWEVEDVTMYDFRDIVDFLLWHNEQEPVDLWSPRFWPLTSTELAESLLSPFLSRSS